MKVQGYPDPGAGLRLHLNENTGGCSPRVLEAIRRLDANEIATYPTYAAAVTACARHFAVDPEWLLLTNGLDEGILMTAIGHISRARITDAEAIVPLPAFDPYPNSTLAAGASIVRVRCRPDLEFPTDDVIRAITPKTRLIYLNTPNNPTGQVIALADIRRIADAAGRSAIVLVDEAYIEFGGESFLPALPEYPTVLVGRTFSKAYGLAGMRLGVLIGQPAALDPVRAVTLPFNINAVALAALDAALGDREFLPRYAAQVRESRERLYAACRRLGLRYWESAANYVLVQVGDAAPFVQALAARRIHVRDRSGDPVTPGCIRITAGIVEHTTAAIEALESVVAGR